MGFRSAGFPIKVAQRSNLPESRARGAGLGVFGAPERGQNAQGGPLHSPVYNLLLKMTFHPNDRRPTPPFTQAQSLAEILLQTDRMPVRRQPLPQNFGDAKFFPIDRSFHKQLYPKPFLSSITNFTGEELMGAARDAFPLTWPGATSFAHEEIWPFLGSLNVSPKCLPAIVAKPLARLP